MKFKTKVRTLAVAFIATLLLTLSTTTASAAIWHRAYYDNYFNGFTKCISRGEGVIGHRNHDQRIYGAIAYICYKGWRERKYSMDILFGDGGLGSGGGGGGGWMMSK